MVSKDNLFSLTSKQLKEIINKVKEKLNLSVAGKTKDQLVETLYNLHRGNKFFGKKLLGYSGDVHIIIPERKIDENKSRRKREKKVVQNLQKQRQIREEIVVSESRIKSSEEALKKTKQKIANLEQMKNKKNTKDQARKKYKMLLSQASKDIKGKSVSELQKIRKRIADAKKELDSL